MGPGALRPEKRVDRKGRAVTRHLRVRRGGPAKAPFPAPDPWTFHESLQAALAPMRATLDAYSATDGTHAAVSGGAGSGKRVAVAKSTETFKAEELVDRLLISPLDHISAAAFADGKRWAAENMDRIEHWLAPITASLLTSAGHDIWTDPRRVTWGDVEAALAAAEASRCDPLELADAIVESKAADIHTATALLAAAREHGCDSRALAQFMRARGLSDPTSAAMTIAAVAAPLQDGAL